MPRLSKIGAAALAAFGWTGLQTVTADFLVVAGGGGGGTNNAGGDGGCGGGGAGGYRTGTTTLNPTLSYTVTVGAGGNAGAPDAAGSNGSNSVFSTITSTGGGGGGDSQNGVKRAGDGGSGGGAGYLNNAAGSGNTPSTSPSQGNNGGSWSSGDHGAGGGGATAAGSNTAGSPGAGGAGTANSISGSSVTYAGGGGGGGYLTTGASGGSGGGGQGGSNSAAGVSGTANLGGGGGGGGGGSAPPTVGGNGGSGVVIISYTGPQQFGGGVVTSSGGNTIHTFTTSGTLSPLSSLTASYLIVAGGGGGGSDVGGGGGAGGLLSGSNLTLDTNSIYAVTVGAGGAASTTTANGVSGSSSSFSMVSTTAVGGGGGASASNAAGSSGGSGGGGTRVSGAGGAGTSGQGNNGGSGSSTSGANVSAAGGGGGASAVGSNATGGVGGNGGAGTSSSISGTSTTYAGGGGGRCDGSGTQGTGGSGGGGNAGTTGVAGTANLGGGGGGGSTSGGNGGSGVVIISYAGSTPQMAGGTVTVSGGNVIHTFTSSGYLSPIVNVNNSLRFRASASAYLKRTMAAGSPVTVYTFSAWVKRGELSTIKPIVQGYLNNNNYGHIIFKADNTIEWREFAAAVNYGQVNTNAVFRDPSAWYHIVVVRNGTSLTIYVNGVSQTLTVSTAVNANGGYLFGASTEQRIGNDQVNSAYFDGYMADINFVDGQALTPFSFGSFNGLGVWQPIRYGGSYGTNGFYLPFTANQSYTGTFNGTSQYLSVAANAAFNFTGDFTAECWYYTSTVTNTTQPTLFTIGDDGNGLVVGFYAGNFYCYMLGTGGFMSGVTALLNQWVHVAWVRVGSTNTLYLNGVAQTTATKSGTLSSTGGVTVGRSGSSGTSFGYFQGSVSNFRLNNTALYTANFTPSTSPFTAISGTQLLTLQNATFVDNSTNAFTVTNNGSTPTAITYPFAYTGNTVKDFGPVGNNWTLNNIGILSGSTLDTMTDVPTNTSATVANYATLNPLNSANNGTLGGGNLNIDSNSGSASAQTTAGTMSMKSGKYYFEYTRVQASNGMYFGIIRDDKFISGGNVGLSAGEYGYLVEASGILYVNGSTTSSWITAFAQGNIGMVAYDADTGKVWFGRNGVWGGSGDPAAGTNQAATVNSFGSYGYTAWVRVIGGGSPAIEQGAINFGQQPFTYTPPTGFVALNTFNLPTPTIGATPATTANKYFDISLYTGTSSAQSITNSGGFQPDFVWGKARSTNRFNVLVDAVRGSSKDLYSNSTSAEYTDANVVSGFNSNGFSLGTDAELNLSGNTFVAWQWKANGSGSTNTAGSIISTVSSNTTAGFSIVTYTGNGTNSTVGHGLLVGGVATAPSMVIVKLRSGAGENWNVWHTSLGGNTYRILLNTTGAVDTGSPTIWSSGGINPTSTTFTVGTSTGTNGSASTYVAYCFAAVAGYSAFGSYTGNGSTDGPFVFTGFRPKFVIVKNTVDPNNWVTFDSARDTYNIVNLQLYPNTSDAEVTGSSTNGIDFLSNGFKVRSSFNWGNRNGDTIIYMAFAESPFKYANAR